MNVNQFTVTEQEKADIIEKNKQLPIDKRICWKCGHQACPYCLTWCDVLLYSPNDMGNHEAVEPYDDDDPEDCYPDACCAGECSYF